MSNSVLAFGPFRLSVGERTLRRGGQHIRLGSRALEILIALVKARGEVVGHRTLIEAAWPDTFVDDSNLRVQLSALRKLLGSDPAGTQYVVNVPGRGYRLTSPIQEIDADHRDLTPDRQVATPSRLPVLSMVPIGRQDVVDEIIHRLETRRCLTIVGPGGIGKTTVAIAVAEKLARSFSDGLRFVDLGPVENPRSVPDVLCALLDVAVRSANPLDDLLPALSDRQMLIVLDCCERVIDAAAELSAAILRGAPGIHLLATSREALRVDSEHVYRLPSLDFPPLGPLSLRDAFRYSAIQLFVQRAQERDQEFRLDDESLPLVADICRHLDGIALPIELAAGLIDVFGVSGLHSVLDDRFRLLGGGSRRNAVPRHHTVQAMIDWSVDLLSPLERGVLGRLSVFAGYFDLDAALAVAAEDGEGVTIIGSLANLVQKSLLSAETSGYAAAYRMLDVTRASMLAHLRDSGEFPLIARRHLKYYLRVFAHIEQTWATRPKPDQLEAFRRLGDNLRVALTWGFSAAGEPELAVELVIASVQFWMHLALFSEGIGWVRAALRIADPGTAGATQRVRLEWALGWLLMRADGPSEECLGAYERSLVLAERLGDLEYQLRATSGQAVWCFNRGRMIRAAQLVEPLRAIAEGLGDRPAQIHCYLVAAFTGHMLGHQATARENIDYVLANYDDACRRVDDLRFILGQISTVSSYNARILWLQGSSDRAVAVVAEDLQREDTRAHAVTYANALLHGLLIVAGCGELQKTVEWAAALGAVAQRHMGSLYRVRARAYEAIARLEESPEAADVLHALGEAISDARQLSVQVYLAQLLGPYALALLRAGRTRDARAAIDEALAVSTLCEEFWIRPELLRIDGEVTRKELPLGAEAKFRESIELSREQSAVWWELRAAISLAELMLEEDRAGDVPALLGPVLDRLTEGFQRPDVVRARAIVERARRS